MPPAPLTASLLAGITGTLGLVHLALDPGPLSERSALLVAAGMAIITLVVTTGVLLSRGRWSRWSLLGLGGGWVAITARADLDPLAFGIVAGGAAMIGIAAGPWLPRWLRHRPSAEGPPPAAVVLLLSLLAMPVLIGISGPDPGLTEWLSALWSLALATAVSRASAAGLWAGRLLHLPVGAMCALAIGLPAGLGVAAAAAGQTALLWRRDVHMAVSPLLPRPSPATPIPPELVDPAILREAGLDDRGEPTDP